ncbi:MAG: hypothetical protein FWE89_01195, partial [Syntrophaceae bacterium]|nr:hypothetical protein [Syntrophaceae bacterium]
MPSDRKEVYIYERVPSFIGEVGIVRLGAGRHSMIRRILLPVEDWPMEERIRKEFPLARPATAPGLLYALLSQFLAGEAADFSSLPLDFEGISAFVRRALEA